MPRRWKPTSRNSGKNWDRLEPLDARALSPAEIQTKRLELCEDLLSLVVQDGLDLPPTAQDELRRLAHAFTRLRRYL